jgi:hypothetical protein
MTDLKKKVNALNKLTINGDSIEALKTFYSTDMEMQENEETPIKGKSVSISTERNNLQKVKGVESNLLNQAINEDENVVFSEWKIMITYNDDSKYQLTNVSVQHWVDGQISREKFYYKEFQKID